MGYPCERCQTPMRREDRPVIGQPYVSSRYFCPACEDAVPVIRRPNMVYPGMIYA